MKPKVILSCSLLASLLLAAVSASAQNIFIADWDADNIYSYTPGGVQSTFTSGGLSEPISLAFDHSGNLYVSASINNEVYKYTGNVQSSFAAIPDPSGMAFDSAGNLYVDGFNDGDIYRITSGGSVSTFVTGLNNPTGLAFDSSGDLLVNNQSAGTILEYQNTGGGILSTSGSIFASGLVGANGLVFDAAGNLYSAEDSTGTGDIMKITQSKSKSIYVSGLGGYGQLAFDMSGNLFMTDGTNVDKITSGLSVSSFAQNLGNATGIAIQNETLPVPEPSVLALSAVGAAALLFRRGKK